MKTTASEQADLRGLVSRLVAEMRRVERMQRDHARQWPPTLAAAADAYQTAALGLVVESRRATQ